MIDRQDLLSHSCCPGCSTAHVAPFNLSLGRATWGPPGFFLDSGHGSGPAWQMLHYPETLWSCFFILPQNCCPQCLSSLCVPGHNRGSLPVMERCLLCISAFSRMLKNWEKIYLKGIHSKHICCLLADGTDDWRQCFHFSHFVPWKSEQPACTSPCSRASFLPDSSLAPPGGSNILQTPFSSTGGAPIPYPDSPPPFSAITTV